MKIDDANAHSYSYDKLYQLVFVDYNDGNTAGFDYDLLGNRLDVNDSGTIVGYEHNKLNQYTSVDGTSYSYDDNGNLINDGTYKYYYDCENRLTDVNDQSDNPVASYKYDYKGRRVRKVVYNSSGQIEEDIRYCYDGDQVIAEYDGNGNLLRKFVYGSGIDEPVCMINVDGQAETVYYYHFDGLGSVRGLSDESGEIVEKYEYDVFGKLTATEGTESTENPYYFTARRLDSETSLYYYRARYYAPNIGRFMQGDPLGLDPAGGKYNPFNPVRQYADGANLYAYVKNNPITNIDPYGLKCHYKEQCKKIGKVYICPPQNTQGNCQDCCDYLYDNLAKPSWLHPCKRFKWYLARKNIMTACLFRV